MADLGKVIREHAKKGQEPPGIIPLDKKLETIVGLLAASLEVQKETLRFLENSLRPVEGGDRED